jgi:hypothetical protein
MDITSLKENIVPNISFEYNGKKYFYNKIISYDSNLSLEIKQSVKRGGGLLLKFYDGEKFILKYEDILNFPVMYGDKLTNYGEAIKSLGIPIKDKNGFYDQW